MPFMTHLFLIFWKNVYMIQIRRHYFMTMIEIIVPVIMGYMFSYGGLIGHSHKNATEAIYGTTSALAHGAHGILHTDEVDTWDGDELSSDAVLQFLNKTVPFRWALAPKKGKAKPKKKKKHELTHEQMKRKEAYTESVAKNPVRHTLGCLPTVVGFLFMLPVFTKRLCEELTSGAKELMSINGLSESAYWLGNLMGAFFEMFLVQTPLITLFRYDPISGATGLWTKSETTVLVVFFTIYSAAASCFAIIIAIVSPRPNIAAILTFIVMVMTLILPITILAVSGATLLDRKEPPNPYNLIYQAVCLLPNVGFAYGITLICESEELGEGITWKNFASHRTFHQLSLRKISIALLTSCSVSLALAWYLKNVWPFGYSFPKPWWFLVMTFGPVICRTDILKGITFKIFQGHITSLLGRNGAGKSTLLRTIVGSVKPDSGTCFVNGMDVRKQKKAVRQAVGYCPQHFALYREMTVEENLWLFGRIRGMSDTQTADSLQLIVMSFQMLEYKETLVKRLNTGQKRKLQLGISLIGEPQMLLLDEPTVGCDTEARNALWHAILKNRAQRGILLATNSIEEADILGDRSAIISTGSVRCCGSSIFLRRKYGIGYRLHMTTTEMPNVKHIVGFLKTVVESAEVFLERRGFLVFSLGNPEHVKLVKLMQAIETNKRNLGIFTMGLAATSLEDVLLKVDEENVGMETDESSDPESSGINAETAITKTKDTTQMNTGKDEEPYKRDFVPVTGFRLWRLQFWALMCKKMSYCKRSYLAIPLLVTTIFVTALIRTLSYYLFHFDLAKYVQLHKQAISPTATEIALLQKEPAFKELYYMIREGPKAPLFKFDIQKVSDSVVDPVFTVVLIARIVDSLTIPLLLSLLAAAYVFLPTEETFTKAKAIQLMTGITASRYWFMSFFIDMASYTIACIIALLPLFIIDPWGLTKKANIILSTYLGLFCFFGVAFIPTCYVTSFFVETSAVAYFGLIVESFITGTVTSIVLFLFDNSVVLALKEKSRFHRVLGKLELPLRVVPNFAVNRGVGNVNKRLLGQLVCCNLPIDLLVMLCNHESRQFGTTRFTPNETEYWDRMVEGCPGSCQIYDLLKTGQECVVSATQTDEERREFRIDLLIMFITGFGLLLACVFLDAKLQSRTKSSELLSREELRAKKLQMKHVDPTILEERERVEALVDAMTHGEEEGLLGLLVHKLGKTYREVSVIGQLSFTVQPGEIFGVLGLQQSGRSTVLAILAGDRELGRGNAYIEGWGIRRNPKQYLKRVGYCPEEDPLIFKLTGREMLALIARLRGLTHHVMHKEIHYILHQVGLMRHSKHLTVDYGSGARRKMSLAMSLVGDPALVILDECTSGVDPISRGRLFRAITRIQRSSGMAVLFTSHCMRECDQLCTRVGILSGGDFTRVGDTVALKQSATQGCTIIVKLTVAQSTQEGSIKEINRGIKREFPNSVIAEKREDQMRYRLKPNVDYPLIWSEVVSKLHKLQEEIKFEDFLVNDTSLGEVFIGFARERKMVDFGDNQIRYYEKDAPPGIATVPVPM
ncbi:phospholipid-transporting ATPase ABCA3-like isoform X1 [Dermacentor variabilis]|uniref:phospholipid-transporting ATPase ABCA3-like isoform X1 n=1 Tax=Dermacentor variabilis TaxID=34621 RepID=UPI003F5B3185